MRLERHIVREPARRAGTRNGTSNLMRAYAGLSIAAVCLTIGAVSAQAQSIPGDVERGRELAERVCSNCHKMLHRKRPWLSVAQLSGLLTPGQ